jgi:hypothetical protein
VLGAPPSDDAGEIKGRDDANGLTQDRVDHDQVSSLVFGDQLRSAPQRVVRLDRQHFSHGHVSGRPFERRRCRRLGEIEVGDDAPRLGKAVFRRSRDDDRVDVIRGHHSRDCLERCVGSAAEHACAHHVRHAPVFEGR